MNLIAELFSNGTPLLLDPRWLSRAKAGLIDIAPTQDRPTTHTRVGNVAVVNVDGPLLQRSRGGYEGYDRVLSNLRGALADPSASAVVLRINSPGGQAAGAFESVRQMRDAKAAAGKPVIAFADEHAYSGAYAIASAADKVYLPEAGGVGSVGVISVLEDYSKMNEKFGLNVKVITSGARKADGHPDVPLTPEVVAREQEVVDHLAGIFASEVGKARGMTKDAVLALQADTFEGARAVKAGLADGVASFEQVLSAANGAPQARAGRFASVGLSDEDRAVCRALGVSEESYLRTLASEHAPPPALDRDDLRVCELVGVSPEAYARAEQKNPGPSGLTPEDLRVCDMMGVSPEAYARTLREGGRF